MAEPSEGPAPVKPGSPLLAATPASASGTPAPVQAQSGTPVSGTGQSAELEARFETWKREVSEENQRNLSRLTSKLQGQHAQDLAQRDQEIGNLRAGLRQAQIAGVPEDQRVQFERDSLVEEKAELERLNSRLQQEVSMASEMGSLAQYYVNMGVPIVKLDFSSVENLSQSGALELTNVVSDLRSQLETAGLQGGPGPVTPAALIAPLTPTPLAPKVLPGTIGVTGAGIVTLEDIRKSVSDATGRHVSMEEIYRTAEKNPNGSIAQRIREYLQTREAECQG